MLMLNQQPYASAATDLAALIDELQLPARGLAIVLNQRIVPQSLWASTRLQQDPSQPDQVEIFQLVAGG